MRAWTRGRRLLALFLSVIFTLGVLAAPASAASGKSRSFSSGSSSSYKSSGSRSFSSSKSSSSSSSSKSSSSSSTPSRSFSSSSPGGTSSSSTASPSKSGASSGYSSNAGGYSSTNSPAYSSTNSPAYSSTTSPSYSSGSRSFSSDDWSFSSTRPSGSSGGTSSGPTVTEIPGSSYDPSSTKYPDMPPVIVTGPTTFGGSYWHDYYYGQPLYWRMFHRPVYYGSGFAFNWMALVGAFVAVWLLLGLLSAARSRRRRRW